MVSLTFSLLFRGCHFIAPTNRWHWASSWRDKRYEQMLWNDPNRYAMTFGRCRCYHRTWPKSALYLAWGDETGQGGRGCSCLIARRYPLRTRGTVASFALSPSSRCPSAVISLQRAVHWPRPSQLVSLLFVVVVVFRFVSLNHFGQCLPRHHFIFINFHHLPGLRVDRHEWNVLRLYHLLHLPRIFPYPRAIHSFICLGIHNSSCFKGFQLKGMPRAFHRLQSWILFPELSLPSNST